jgi:hypothetical protein
VIGRYTSAHWTLELADGAAFMLICKWDRTVYVARAGHILIPPRYLSAFPHPRCDEPYQH